MKKQPGAGQDIVPDPPFTTLADGLARARAPFPPATVQFKVQATSRTKALVVPYAGVQACISRLNDVWGDHWSDEYYPGVEGELWCHLTVCGVKRIDVGEGVGKGACTDALKRAGRKFEIGGFLYAIDKQYLDLKSEHIRQAGDKTYITAAGERHLRDRYIRWVKTEGRVFGEPYGFASTAVQETTEVVDETNTSIGPPAKPLDVAKLTPTQLHGMLVHIGADVPKEPSGKDLEKALLSLTPAQTAEAGRHLMNLGTRKGGEK